MRWKSCSKTMAVLAVLFGLAAYGAAATVTVLYSFKDRSDGYSPAGVIMVNGRLYGTTASGGTYDNGTVFELVHTSSGWVKTALHEFTGGADGYNPGALAADKSGNLYGAAGRGAGGLIFEMSRRVGGGWRFAVIHAFTGNDGEGPDGLIADEAGNVYGVTGGGGGKGCQDHEGCGTVFQLTPGPGGKWKLTTVHRFDGSDGSEPLAPLYRDARDNLYGTTGIGGGRGCPGGGGCGTAFELSPSGGRWKLTVLHRFSGGSDSGSPSGSLVMDPSGSLYGTTEYGNGVVYKLTPGGDGWKYSIVHRFSGRPDGSGPNDGVVFSSNGDMYGTTAQGGAFYQGTIFELEPSAKGWKESVLFSFDVSDGYDPVSLVSGGHGKYYGTTWVGGDGSCQGPGCGLVFEFVP